MSEREFSKDGNIPHVPEQQANEAELPPGNEAELHPPEVEAPPPENDYAEEAEGHEAEILPTEAETPPPEKDDAVEAQGHEAEIRPTESPPPENDGAGDEAKQNPVETKKSPPKKDGSKQPERLASEYYRIDAILARLEKDDREVEGHEAERNLVEAEPSPRKKFGSGRAQKQKPLFHPANEILSRTRNDDAGEAEGQEVDLHPTESRDSNLNSSLEGAVGGVDDRNINVRIYPGKEDIFEKFFSDEYDQAKAPILGRQRHSAQKQRPRHRHVSEDSKLSDPNPFGCLQDVGTSSGAVLNQAGAIIGKHIPKEEIPEYARFGTEFGQSLPLIPTKEGSERSIGSISTAPIGEIYGGTFSVISDLSCDSLESAQRISFASFSSRPPTDTSDNLETSPPPDSNSSEEDKKQFPMATNSKNIAHEKPVMQRRSDIVVKPEQIRCKSALAGLSAYAGESEDRELRQRALSKDRSVRSEPLPQRKISKDSSVDSSEKISLEDEANYTDSLESDSYIPVSDIDTAVDSLEQNLGSLAISKIESAAVVQNVASGQNEASETAEQDSETKTSSPEVSKEQDTEGKESAEKDPETKSSSPEDRTS